MSKYKVGDKFIVEIKEVLNDELPYDKENLYKIDGFKTLVFDDYGLDKLQKINPKLRIENIDDMLAEHDLKKESYEKGLQDVWELVKKIIRLYSKDKNGLFGNFATPINEATKNLLLNIMSIYSPQQALAKIEAYEKSQQIQVGDVVYEKMFEDNGYGVITDLCDDECCVLWDEGYCNKIEIEKLVKTGRHLDIEHILEQIRGNE